MDTETNTPSADSPKGLPEIYIRTLESDIETFKKGGVPELTPFKRPGQVSEGRLAEVSPTAPDSDSVEVAVPEPEPKSEPALELPPKPEPEPLLELKKAEPEPLPPPPPLPPEEQKPTPIETYAGDFSDRMKETKASAVTVLAAEQDAGARPQPAPQKPKGGGRWYIAAGIILLVAGSVGVYFAYSRYLVALAPVNIAPAASAPIFVDARESVSGTGTALTQEIEQSTKSPLAPNTVRLLTLAAATATSTTDVFSALGTNAPGILLRNLNATGDMAGVVNTSSGQSPFFILSVDSYSSTFSGMLSWEPTMQSDLGALFPLYPAPAEATTSASKAATATATPSSKNQTGGFRDEVVNNHDVRVYRDAAGRSILLYGYWDQATLVIARDPAAFAEILGRLATSHS